MMKKTNALIRKFPFFAIILSVMAVLVVSIGCSHLREVYANSSYSLDDFLIDEYEARMEVLKGYKGYSGKVFKITPVNGVNWDDFSKAIYCNFNLAEGGQRHITVSMSVLVEDPHSDRAVTSAYKPSSRVWSSHSSIQWKGPGNIGWTIQSDDGSMYEQFGGKPSEPPAGQWVDLTFSQSIDFPNGASGQLYLDGHNENRGLIDQTLYIRHFKIEMNSSNKFIALTFDDGPTDFTPYLVDKLNEMEVKATFFILDEGIEASHPVYDINLSERERQSKSDERRALLKMMVDEGHEIAILFQSYNSSMSEAAIRKGLEDTQLGIQKAVYGVSDYRNQPMVSKYFRIPSGTDVSAVLNRVAIGMDLAIINGADAGRSAKNAPEQSAETVFKQSEPWGIIINKDPRTDPAIIGTLEIIIPMLKADGYQFVTLSEMVKRRKAGLIPGNVYDNLDPNVE